MKFSNPVKKEVIVRYSPCGFSRKKKPISMIKALELRDRMERKKIFYNSETWLEIRKEHFKNAIFLAEEGSGDIDIQSNHSLPDWAR